jgi:copper(I)-binding protein
MLLELAGPIEEGETFPVTLEFEQAGTVQVEATARKMQM